MREKGDGLISTAQDGEKVATGHGSNRFPLYRTAAHAAETGEKPAEQPADLVIKST
jgi:hypothetical protein